MYINNPYYQEALLQENRRTKARIRLNNLTLNNQNIKNIKYDFSINANEKFSIGGVYGATATIELLNYDSELDGIKFENKEFPIDLCIAMEDLYTVERVDRELVGIIDSLQVKHLTSLWIPQGIFYPTEIVKNENKTITIKVIDKTKYLEEEYICELKPPFTLKQLYDDIHSKLQIVSDTANFYNQDVIIDSIPVGYTAKQLLGYIAECACGFYIINRLGNGEIRQYGQESVKSIEKGKYKKFLPAENYITIQKIKYAGSTIIGSNNGYLLEIDEKNPFITDAVAQNILLKMQGFTFIPYTYQATDSDFAIDVGDLFDITNTDDLKYMTYVMSNSWEFNGSISQKWQAKGENELNNTYSSKGPIIQEIQKIEKEQIPNARDEAIEKATELLTEFNGGYVVKKDGELFISDNVDIDKAQHIWRWNINGLGYSSTGIDGPYGLAITMDGKIVADYILSGTMLADRIKGGTLKIGGINNINGEIQVVDSAGNELVTINLSGITLSNGTKLIGGNGVLSNFKYDGISTYKNFLGYYEGINESLKSQIQIQAYIPQNFVIESANITLIHNPVLYVLDSSTSNFWGYSRNIRLYKIINQNIERIAYINSSYYDTIKEEDLEEIYNAMGEGGFTASVPSNNSHAQQIVQSIDIKQYLINGMNTLVLQTYNSPPSWPSGEYNNINAWKQTGMAQAVLNVIGYMK